jgi:predicted DCC family thiol-disulfide oxidoreductase YuxK
MRMNNEENNSRHSPHDGLLLLYDGTCGFCAAGVQFILRHERNHTLRFAALESDIGRAVRARHPETQGVDSMIWVEASEGAERAVVRSTAALRIAEYMGGAWRVAVVGYLVPQFLRDAVYDLVARNRRSLAHDPEQCLVPPPAVRMRFMD